VLVHPPLQAVDFNTPSFQKYADNIILSKGWTVSFWLWYALGTDGARYYNSLYQNQHTSVEAKNSKFIDKFVNYNNIPSSMVDPSFFPGPKDFGDVKVWEAINRTFLDPYFAPLMTNNLSGLPLTYIATAELDVLRDDGILYSNRLEDAGVDVYLKNYQRAFHGIFNLWDKLQDGRHIMDDIVSFIISEI
jgi:acetyl esterase/lipase